MKRIMEWVKEHKYCYSFLYLILYLLAFFLMEQISEPQYLIHSNLDDKIPFNSYFLIFYVSWYIAFVGSLIFFMFYDKKDYQDLSFIMMNGTTLIFIIYFINNSAKPFTELGSQSKMFKKKAEPRIQLFTSTLGVVPFLYKFINCPTEVCTCISLKRRRVLILFVFNNFGYKLYIHSSMVNRTEYSKLPYNRKFIYKYLQKSL